MLILLTLTLELELEQFRWRESYLGSSKKKFRVVKTKFRAVFTGALGSRINFGREV